MELLHINQQEEPHDEKYNQIFKRLMVLLKIRDNHFWLFVLLFRLYDSRSFGDLLNSFAQLFLILPEIVLKNI